MANSAVRQDGSSIRELGRNFVRLGRDGLAALLVPWLGIAVVDFGFVALAVAVTLIAANAGPGTTGGVLVQIIAVLQGIAIMTLRVALLKTLRDVGMQGPDVVGTAGAVARDIIDRIVPAFLITLVMGIIVTVGLALCVLPGLIALFIFAFAPYLVVARGRQIMDALRESVRWAGREWLLLLTALVVAIIAVGLWSILIGTITAIGVRPTVAVPVGMVVGWLGNTILGYLVFLWWGAVYITADSHHQVESLRKTAPGADQSEGPRTYEY